jgi:isocitrate dehydrogenase
MSTKTPITIAKGDGIGPEIMDATLKILEAAGAQLDYEEIEVGQKVFERGVMNGIEDKSWESLHRTGVLLKGPIFTPSGGGYKSVNVTIRKGMSLYANVRPCQSFAPYIDGLHDKMDMVIVRENEEDLYAGIEHRLTQDVTQALKLISRPGSERIIRYAFEYARANGRKKVTCMVKDNIMKIVDGLFYKVFEEIGAEYPDIEKDRIIIDIGAARIASRPMDFDVIVTENLYGDIVSDIAAEVAGSVGLGISSNIGEKGAMFEAMHGTAPDIAGKGIANPSGLLLASIMMLVHIGQGGAATRVHNAWLKTIEDGIHTGDIYKEGLSKQRVGTAEFSKAVVERMGQKPVSLPVQSYPEGTGALKVPPLKTLQHAKKDWVGADIYIEVRGREAKDIFELMSAGIPNGISLQLISNRGVKIWPGGQPGTKTTDLWRLRFKGALDNAGFLGLQKHVNDKGFSIVKFDGLYSFDGKEEFTSAAG